MPAAFRALAVLLLTTACATTPAGAGDGEAPAATPSAQRSTAGHLDVQAGQALGPAVAPPATGTADAVFAGGCFWCMESTLEGVPGIIEVISGYTGGTAESAVYKTVGRGGTAHVEAVLVRYDPSKLTYDQLLSTFWFNVDPTQDDGQFCDRGAHYRSWIYPGNAEERAKAEASKAAMAERLGKPIVTEIADAMPFYVAEEYHQDFYLKNPGHYLSYRMGCGRDRRLQALWGDDALGLGAH